MTAFLDAMLAAIDIPVPGSPILVVALVLGIGLAVGLACQAVLRLAGTLSRRTKIASDDELARRLPLPLSLMAGAFTAGTVLRALAGELTTGWEVGMRRALVMTFILGAGWAVVRGFRVFLDVAAYKRPRLEPATRVTGRLIAVAVYAAALLIILAQFGIYVTPILAGLGIAGIVIGLALQDTMANFFAGIWIQTEQPLAPGHYVRVEGTSPSVEGFVDRVGWRATRIRVLAGNLVMVPNSKLSQSIVTDFNLPTPMMSVVMKLKVPYDVDPQRVISVLVEEAKAASRESEFVLEDPAPFAHCADGFDDGGVGYSLIIKVPEFVAQWNAQAAVWTRVWARFGREGIPLLYPTRINLQSDGAAFAPLPPGQARRPRRAVEPVGQDPLVIEAENAKKDIAARQHAEGKPVENPPKQDGGPANALPEEPPLPPAEPKTNQG